MEKNKKKSRHHQPLTLSSLPDEILENILARISKWNYPNLSLVSKRFLSLLSSPQIYTTRSNIGTTELCLYFCLKLSKNQSPDWYTLWMKPTEAQTDDDDDDIPGDYSLVHVPCYPHPHCVPHDLSTVAVGSDIYLIGAPENSPPTSAVHIFDCMSNTWRDGPNMMVARECANAVFVDGKIYAMGGCGKDESMAPWMEVLDIKTQTWSSLPSHGADELCSSEQELTTHMLEGKIHAVADRKDYAYDLKKGTWEVVETHSSCLWIYALCVIENVLYCYTNSNFCMWYDSRSRKWREVKGSNLELLLGQDTCCLAQGKVLDLVAYGGKLLVVWMTVHIENAKQIKRIRCAKMALEKRHGGGVWGKMEWANAFLTVPESFDMLSSCVVVSI